MQWLKLTSLALIFSIAGCATTQTADQCGVHLKAPLRTAMAVVEDRLASGCGAYYEGYVADLIDIAKENPAVTNKKAFSDFLVSLSDQGMISKRQAKQLYNRYFYVKFVSLDGEYSTCSQVCPVRDKTLLDMRQELLDKEVGLLQASNDKAGYYRADLLLKESEIVLEATCRACAGGSAQ